MSRCVSRCRPGRREGRQVHPLHPCHTGGGVAPVSHAPPQAVLRESEIPRDGLTGLTRRVSSTGPYPPVRTPVPLSRFTSLHRIPLVPLSQSRTETNCDRDVEERGDGSSLPSPRPILHGPDVTTVGVPEKTSVYATVPRQGSEPTPRPSLLSLLRLRLGSVSKHWVPWEKSPA